MKGKHRFRPVEGPCGVLFTVQVDRPEDGESGARNRDRTREINLVRDLSSPELNSMRHLDPHKVSPRC
jgi:hypothetical protein